MFLYIPMDFEMFHPEIKENIVCIRQILFLLSFLTELYQLHHVDLYIVFSIPINIIYINLCYSNLFNPILLNCPPVMINDYYVVECIHQKDFATTIFSISSLFLRFLLFIYYNHQILFLFH
jgi:hypothetical protein